MYHTHPGGDTLCFAGEKQLGTSNFEGAINMSESQSNSYGQGASATAGSTEATSTSPIIGISICTNCHSRFRVQQKYEAMVGKSIRCPKCHQEFVMKIETPTLVEQAAITNAEEPSSKKRTKRTKIQIRKHHLSAIKKAMRPLHLRLSQLASQDKSSEEQVRVWCIDVLRNVLV